MRNVAGSLALVLGVILSAEALAAPDASLATEGPEEVLVETERTLDVSVTGVVATVTDRQRIVADKVGGHEAVYGFSLPAAAAVTNLEVKLAGGRVARGVVVPTEAALAKLEDPDAVQGKPDVALLRMIPCATDGEDVACYELRVYPIDPKGVEIRTTWIAPVRYSGGRLVLRIPGRGKAPNLAGGKVNLEISAPNGAGGFTEIAGGGTSLARNVGAGKGRYSFKAPAGRDVVIDAAPWFPDDELLATYAAAKVDDAGGVLVVGLLAPPPKASSIPRFARVLFVIDVSRSMQASGILAARDLSSAVLAAVGKDVKVEAVLFDRKVRRVFGGFVGNDKDARRKLEAALAIPAPANGSDLGAALDQIGPILTEAKRNRASREEERGLGPDSLVVLLSDGHGPVALDGARARDRLGDEAAEEVQVVGITIFPDGVVAPDPTTNALGSLASRTGGRAVAVRDTDAGGIAKRIAADLTRPAPLTEAHLGTGTAWIDGLDLPGELLPGEGVLAIGRFRGELPKSLVLTGYKASKEIAVELGAAGTDVVKAALPLWAAGARIEDFLDAADRGTAGAGTDGWKVAKRRLVGVATRARAVTPWTSYVAVDPEDAFARDRLAFVEKWGGALYQRLPPPVEREAGKELSTEIADVEPAGGRRTAPQVKIGHVTASGGLDKAIVRRLVRTHVIPLAKACYDRALRKDDRLAGSLELVFELSRGEVVVASIERSTFGLPELEACVTDAVFTIDVPRVVETDREITMVRYPLTFVVEGAGGTVTDEVKPEPKKTDPDDPLEGILDAR